MKKSDTQSSSSADDTLNEFNSTDAASDDMSVTEVMSSSVISSEESSEETSDGTEYEDTGITKPFNPTEINIRTQQMSMDTLIKRMREGDVDLAPDFQRAEVWKPVARSRLIESLLIRIPLPAFYMDATDEDRWLVVDGLQRLSTFRDFVITKKLRLENLEFLTQFDGRGYDELPRNYQRRIEETQVTVYLIEKGTPPEVKFNIFKRINTGGLPLSAQEIRHALNQGPVVEFLKGLAASGEFKRATCNGVSDGRMAARECVLRFMAFTMTSYENYSSSDFDAFLSAGMAKLNKATESERHELAIQFKRAVDAAHRIFGKNAFRKLGKSKYRHPVNKALFEVWTVALNRLSESALRRLETMKVTLNERVVAVTESDADFMNAISQGTGDVAKVQIRFGRVQGLLQEMLK